MDEIDIVLIARTKAVSVLTISEREVAMILAAHPE